MTKPRPGTLGYLFDDGYRLALHCAAKDERGTPCNHFAWADMAALVERLGPDHSYIDPALNGKFRCSKCGSKNVTSRLHPGGEPDGPRAERYIIPPRGG